MEDKFCNCIKKVRKTGKNESNSIAICTKSVLQSRNKTLKAFRCKKHRYLKTQTVKGAGIAPLTKRLLGGQIDDEAKIAKMKADNQKIVKIFNDTPLDAPSIVNPDSKFVVITYWWGRNNQNKNLIHPCLDNIKELRKEIMAYIRREDYESDEAWEDEIEAELAAIEEKTIKKYMDTHKVTKEQAKEIVAKKSGSLTYAQMIKRWEVDCSIVQCNYLSQEYPQIAEEKLYQAAINGKPIFIKKALEACYPRSVVYIDGDMRMNVYPSIFDMKNIDFMARNWNIDPRSNAKYLKKDICFDPYVFETSGGIQYFAPTPASYDLLETWILSNEINPGKADDRIISLAFNVLQYGLPLSYVQLPIEYLWLTDYYHFQRPEDASQKDSIVEHPECLTGEDTATEAGASSNRTPLFYGELVEGTIDCERYGGVFYEYIFFDSEEQVQTMSKYLNYLKIATNKDLEHMFKVVSYSDKYGPKYNAIADKNQEAAYKLMATAVCRRDNAFDTTVSSTRKSKSPAIIWALAEVEKRARQHYLAEKENSSTSSAPSSKNSKLRDAFKKVYELYERKKLKEQGVMKEDSTAAITEDDKHFAVQEIQAESIKDCSKDPRFIEPLKEIFEEILGQFGEVFVNENNNETAVIKVLNIPQILAHLMKDKSVIYLPEPNTESEVINSKKDLALDFIATNKNFNDDLEKYPDLRPDLDLTKPMFFSHKNRVLRNLLKMCEGPESINKVFNSSFIFFSRIRCYWIHETS